jgi:2,3-bisphosphoglycerate-independent phosphoglycerate mutase
MNDSKQVILLILDGWGVMTPGPGNAISLAKTPTFDRLWKEYPHTTLLASGEAVGLPESEAGNTETGHINIGAGRVVYQDLEKINMAIADGSFNQNQTLKKSVDHVQKNQGAVHLLGLLGPSGIHSSKDHLYALINYYKTQGVKDIFLHIITDGRDSPPTSAKTYLRELTEKLQASGVGQIASLMGRYWAMDRDRRWERTKEAYEALTMGTGELVKTPEEMIDASYQNGITDEFIKPALITNASGQPLRLINNNDTIVFFNFRIDRPRQLTAVFLTDNFTDPNLLSDFDPYLEKYEQTNLSQRSRSQTEIKTPFAKSKNLTNLFFATMTQYSKGLVEVGAHALFPPEKLTNTLGEIVATHKLKQLRISESEKERFVSYYFSGQNETLFPGEDRITIPSPAVSTYDKKPEMSLFELTDTVLEKMTGGYALSVVNFANPDMVAHTGSIGATVAACEAVDLCLKKLSDFILTYGGTLVITADHGNAEEMIHPQTNQIDTEHNANPVPFIVVDNKLLGKTINNTGILADVAPTILSLMGLTIPTSMSGKNLL